jgi:hypothetical protein
VRLLRKIVNRLLKAGPSPGGDDTAFKLTEAGTCPACENR